MFAEILTIGDELTRGEIVDSNSSWLAGQLWDLDVTVRWMTSCRDDEADLRRAVTEAAGRADLVLCSGGLGPTEDDLTVDVVSALAGVVPVIDEAARARLEMFLGARQAPMMPLQLRQVRIPTGATVLANPAGLAPGFEIGIGTTPVVCLPGFPRELHAIWAAGLGDRVRALREARGGAPRIARRIYRVFGRGESQISAACRGVVDDVPGATIHYQVKFPETMVKIVIKDPDGDAARGRLEEVDAALRTRLGPHLYGTGDAALPEVLGATLRDAGLTVATAESCTGGMIAQLLTSAPGSSAYVVGGAVVYANREKERQLGVRPETLASHGAVSEACVREMARGARARFGVDLAVAVSGIAGPDGGTADKPVGTVWLAVARPARRDDAPDADEVDGVVVDTKLLTWPGPRDS
ncbi:MAG: CinA family nicotinamide mononucleotide deamidase-related protein, partial [Myxococcales bacterium]|nr:CinA family nicotinamide mononucleotide deamidase-related protein [Myxococcales bacterium]